MFFWTSQTQQSKKKDRIFIRKRIHVEHQKFQKVDARRREHVVVDAPLGFDDSFFVDAASTKWTAS
jgi:hypothetical protein